MKRLRTQVKPGLWLSLFLLMAVFQNCSKNEELTSPAPLAASDAANASLAPCKVVGLVAGQHALVGTVGVAMASNGDALVTYTITAPGIYLNSIHLDAFESIAQLQAAKKISGGGAIPGKLAFSKSWATSARATTYTQVIPKAYLAGLNSPDECFFIASHAALSNGESAWGGLYRNTSTGVSLDQAKQFPGANWSVYFEFCKSECASTIDFTYAWEDLNLSGNDGDYNDLVVQSKVTKSRAELKIDFLATARGAGYDHKFKFRIPKTGIVDVFGENGETIAKAQDPTNPNFYVITVFESTKAALPASPGDPEQLFANTSPSQTACTPYASKQVTLTIDDTFPFNAAAPYEPFISVYTTGSVNSGSASYDLYIYDVSHRDTWTNDVGKVYPNGILIPSDWRWPLEHVTINWPYPAFNFTTAGGVVSGWATPPVAPAVTFDKTHCN